MTSPNIFILRDWPQVTIYYLEFRPQRTAWYLSDSNDKGLISWKDGNKETLAPLNWTLV